jgi:dTMP kinase
MMIALEGCDGAGKGTQSERLAKRLGAVLMKYPDRTTPLGQIIDRWLKGQLVWHGDDEPVALQGLLLANKIEVQAKLVEALRANGRVVADRYAASAIAYGGADGVDTNWLSTAHAGLIQPDLYILLDISGEVAMERIALRKRMQGEKFNDDAYGAVKERVLRASAIYRAMASSFTGVPWVIVQGSMDRNSVETAIWDYVQRHFTL